MGCGFIWGGGLTWVIAVAPRERRGAVLGSVFAAAIFGTLLGPVLGTLAVTAGTRPVFALVGVASLGLAAWTMRHDEPGPTAAGPETDTPLRTAMRSRRIVLGSWLIVLEAATIGATGTLLPLRLSRFGASGSSSVPPSSSPRWSAPKRPGRSAARSTAAGPGDRSSSASR